MSAAPNLRPANPLTDKQFVNAFVDGVIKTLSLMAMTEVKVGKAGIEKSRHSSRGEVAGVVGMVAGGMRGTLAICYQKAAILQIIENMLGEKHTEIDDAVGDCVGELANQIYGAAKKVLNETGYAFEMAIPNVIRGEFQIMKDDSGPSLVVPFSLENGSQFFVELTVQ